MFLIFKPPQSYLQVQLLDPDGFKKRYNAFEEAYAAQIVKERQRKTKRKKKKPSVEFKLLVEKQLQAGFTEQELIQPIDLDTLRAEVSAIIAEYQTRIETEKRRKKAKRIKVLFLLATMED
ncbi:hypothetical protein EBZ38_12970 [bacterium]|jgi:hypothetical protein|nr:hypothetical protein [bacterium]